MKDIKINDIKSLAHTTWNCKYHVVFAPKYRRKVFYFYVASDRQLLIKPRAMHVRHEEQERCKTNLAPFLI